MHKSTLLEPENGAETPAKEHTFYQRECDETGGEI
jgi:hypothetical protein